MIDKILHNKIYHLIIIFFAFILIGFFLLNSFYADKISVSDNFSRIIHIFSGIISINILNMIFTDNKEKIHIFKNLFLKIGIFIFSGIGLYFFLDLGVINFLIIYFIVTSLIFLIDSRVSFLISLIFLFYVVYYISIGNQEIAEKISIYTYYFLVIGVGLEIFYNLLKTPKIKNIIK